MTGLEADVAAGEGESGGLRDTATHPRWATACLGRSLKMPTTAEGVETEEQVAGLWEEGCNEVQGFLFSHPRPAAEVPLMLRSRYDLGAAKD